MIGLSGASSPLGRRIAEALEARWRVAEPPAGAGSLDRAGAERLAAGASALVAVGGGELMAERALAQGVPLLDTQSDQAHLLRMGARFGAPADAAGVSILIGAGLEVAAADLAAVDLTEGLEKVIEVAADVWPRGPADLGRLLGVVGRKTGARTLRVLNYQTFGCHFWPKAEPQCVSGLFRWV